MGWKLELVETGPASEARCMEVAWLGEIAAPASVDNIGLAHGMAQRMLGDLQRAVVALQEAALRAEADRLRRFDPTLRLNEGPSVAQDPGTSTSEGLANALVNRRINKLQQMRWSAAGAHAVVTMRVDAMNAPRRGGAVATASAA